MTDEVADHWKTVAKNCENELLRLHREWMKSDGKYVREVFLADFLALTLKECSCDVAKKALDLYYERRGKFNPLELD